LEPSIASSISGCSPFDAGGGGRFPASLYARRHPIGRALARSDALYYISNTAKELAMDFIRRLQPRDWTIAIVAFIAGAWIF
jgi:hypothetical protein